MVKNLDKKVWGKDKFVREDGEAHAADYYCVRCYGDKKEVVAKGFWPNADIDIKNYPCCGKCIDDLNLELMIGLYETPIKLFAFAYYYF